jgi:hypothetical protein
MAALDRERKTQKMGENTVVDLLPPYPMKGGVKGFLGGIAVLSGGFLAPATVATGLIAVGIFEMTADNTTGKDGDEKGRIRQGSFPFFNSGGADTIAQIDVGKDCFLIDDQTVAKTDGAGARSRAGKIMAVRDDGMVWVQLGIGL